MTTQFQIEPILTVRDLVVEFGGKGLKRRGFRALHGVSIDVRPGGRFHSCIHNPSFGDCWCVGVYREIVRPERIVYTLATADSEGNEIVVLDPDAPFVVTPEAIRPQMRARIEAEAILAA